LNVKDDYKLFAVVGTHQFQALFRTI